MDDAAVGSPFLVGRGRQRGYRTILAPAFLVRQGLHPLLVDRIGSSGADVPRTQRVELEAGQAGRISITWFADTLTHADIEDSRADGGEPVADKQGRPLRMLYGIVTEGPTLGEVSDADMRLARASALSSYRRFLLDEMAFDVDSSDPLELQGVRSAASKPTIAAAPSDAAEHVAAAVRATGGRAPRRRSPVVIILVVALVLIAGAVLWALADDPKPTQTGPRIVSSTSWTGSLARAAGGTQISLIAPADAADPAAYEPKRSVLEAARDADVVVYSRSDRFAARLARAASGATLVAVGSDTTPKAIHAAVARLARALKTEPAATRWLKRFDATYADLAKRLRSRQPTARARVVAHRRVLSWADLGGVRIVGSFGPAALTPPQIARLRHAKPELVFDDAASPIARDLRSPSTQLVTLSNFPNASLDLIDLFRRNATRIDLALTR